MTLCIIIQSQGGITIIIRNEDIKALTAEIPIKTHPKVRKVAMKAQKVQQTKEGYAEWQLIEEDEGSELV
jgi:hypothetical protein